MLADETLNDEDRQEIARLIAEGYTSGLLQPEDRPDIAWSLEINFTA